MSSVFSLFNILALIYVLRSVQLAITIGREWSTIKQEPLTAHKKSLANQASFFIAVPISVLVHELAHAVVVVLAGGTVVEFVYRVFWGYVIPAGDFTATELWAIAIAGTLGSILFGIVLWQVMRRSESSSLRYFGLRALRYQVYFSLIYYPLFTLFGFDGDWRIIYDFSQTPVLSAATAVAQAAALLLFWRGDRRGWFEAPAFSTVEAADQFAALTAEASANPHDIALQLEVIDTLRRGGATRQANHRLDQLLEQNPDSAQARLELAALQSDSKANVPQAAQQNAQIALDIGLSSPGQRAYAYELIGRYHTERGQLDQAAQAFSSALEALTATSSRAAIHMRTNLLIARSQVYRRKHNYDSAYQDLQQALALSQQTNDEDGQRRIQEELEILAKHANKPYLSIPADPTL